VCAICDPARSTTAWSPQNEGVNCAGTMCATGASCPGCNQCAQGGSCQNGVCASLTLKCCPSGAICSINANGFAKCD
jgi:hypothetical protein